MIYRCQPFDLNDRALIERAYKTGEPRHVAEALIAAGVGFFNRIRAQWPPLVVDGEYLIPIFKSRNFFDEFVIRQIIQMLCDQTGFGVALLKTEGPTEMKQPASPDVEFLPGR